MVGDGFHYCQPTLNTTLSNLPAPTLVHDNHDVEILDSDLKQDILTPTGQVIAHINNQSRRCVSVLLALQSCIDLGANLPFLNLLPKLDLLLLTIQ